ncbi:MAG: hypothetical protein WDZ63_06765 [Burkholderiales bacterium]
MIDNEELGTIDQAIATCDDYISEHRRAATRTLLLFAQFSIVLVAITIGFVLLLLPPSMELSEQVDVSTLFSNSIIFALIAIFLVMFGVLMSIYRFHLNETSKAEHPKLGFMRIRVAANNSGAGFQTDVRVALTDQAFAFLPQQTGMFRSKRIESPIPGHPTSDLAALLLDKLLDRFELVARKEKNP